MANVCTSTFISVVSQARPTHPERRNAKFRSKNGAVDFLTGCACSGHKTATRICPIFHLVPVCVTSMMLALSPCSMSDQHRTLSIPWLVLTLFRVCVWLTVLLMSCFYLHVLHTCLLSPYCPYCRRAEPRYSIILTRVQLQHRVLSIQRRLRGCLSCVHYNISESICKCGDHQSDLCFAPYLKRMYLTQNHMYRMKTTVAPLPKASPSKNEYWSKLSILLFTVTPLLRVISIMTPL